MVPSFKCKRNNFIIDKGCYVVGENAYKVMQKGDKMKQVTLDGREMAGFVMVMRPPN
jgi:hypothetical protein